jgi:hypothetical protein
MSEKIGKIKELGASSVVEVLSVAAPANGRCVFIWTKKILNPMYNYKRIDSSLAGEQKDSTTITKSSMK